MIGLRAWRGIRRLAREWEIVSRPLGRLKEPLVLEFPGLSEQARDSESGLETAIINPIERFLLVLGKGFLFEARQKRFSFGDEHFFADRVFTNRLPRRTVPIDLKLGKLTHQDFGQMQMDGNTFDRQVRREFEKRHPRRHPVHEKARGAGHLWPSLKKKYLIICNL